MGLYYNKDHHGGQRPILSIVEDEPATTHALREDVPRSARTTVRRRAGRARYDTETIDAILDEGLVAHVAFTSGGQPYTIPMLYARGSEEVYLHGRSGDVRGPSDAELEATEVVAMEIVEASAKIRSGPPVDAAEDYKLPVWAGELPLRLTADRPKPDRRCTVSIPSYVKRYGRASR